MAATGQSTSLLFTRGSVREVDRAAIEEFAIPGIVLMENAARALAEAALEMLGTDRAAGRRVIIVCGPGNNGGDGYALARHLHNVGCQITPLLIKRPKEGTDAGTNFEICRRMKLAEQDFAERDSIGTPDLIVDAVLGTGLDRVVEGEPAKAIEWMNSIGAPILAVDAPSGLDCDTGKPLGVAVRAACTVTFVGMKAGFVQAHARPYVGRIIVGDIGVPIELMRRFGRPARD